jgi:hypothetical protein
LASACLAACERCAAWLQALSATTQKSEKRVPPEACMRNAPSSGFYVAVTNKKRSNGFYAGCHNKDIRRSNEQFGQQKKEHLVKRQESLPLSK